jgi:hypothetical protein
MFSTRNEVVQHLQSELGLLQIFQFSRDLDMWVHFQTESPLQCIFRLLEERHRVHVNGNEGLLPDVVLMF